MAVPNDRWRHLRNIAAPLFAAAIRLRTLGSLTLIVVFAFSLNGLNVVNSYVGRFFMTSLADRDAAAFYTYAVCYLCVFAISTIVAVFFQFFQDRLALFWRQYLTKPFVLTIRAWPTTI